MEDFSILLNIFLIIAIGFASHKFVKSMIDRLYDKELLPESLLIPFKGILKWLLLVFIFLLILQQIGIPISRVVAALASVLVLIAIGFIAFWSVLTNILSSFLLVIFAPFRIGDTVEIREPDKEKGTIGKVIDLNIFYTTLIDTTDSDPGKTRIRIPNSLFFQRIIICHEGDNTQSLKHGHKSNKSQE